MSSIVVVRGSSFFQFQRSARCFHTSLQQLLQVKECVVSPVISGMDGIEFSVTVTADRFFLNYSSDWSRHHELDMYF